MQTEEPVAEQAGPFKDVPVSFQHCVTLLWCEISQLPANELVASSLTGAGIVAHACWPNTEVPANELMRHGSHSAHGRKTTSSSPTMPEPVVKLALLLKKQRAE